MLKGTRASLQLLLFQNPTPMHVITMLDHLVEVVNLLASPELIGLGSSVQTASQASSYNLHLVSLEGTVA